MDFKGSFAMQESLFLRVYDKYLSIWDTNEIYECLAFGLFHTQSHFITLGFLELGSVCPLSVFVWKKSVNN